MSGDTNQGVTSADNEFKSLLLLILQSKIQLSLVVQWISSTKTPKYSSSNDYTSIRELNQRSPVSFAQYYIEELKTLFNALMFKHSTPLGSGQLTATPTLTVPTATTPSSNDFPPLSAPIQHRKSASSSNNNQQQQQGGQHVDAKSDAWQTIQKDQSDQVDAAVEIYCSIMFNRLYTSTMLTEFNFLLMILSAIQRITGTGGGSGCGGSGQHSKASMVATLSTLDQSLFPSVAWALHFCLRALNNLQPLLVLLHPKLLLQLSDNKIVEQYDQHLSQSLKASANRVMEENKQSLSARKKSSRMISPFRTQGETDPYQKMFRKTEDPNRQKCLDEFHDLIRVFQATPGSISTGGATTTTSSSIDMLSSRVDKFFNQLLNRKNIWWFCDFFIDQYQQCCQLDIDEQQQQQQQHYTPSELATSGTNKEQSPWNQERMMLLQKRMEQGGAIHLSPSPSPSPSLGGGNSTINKQGNTTSATTTSTTSKPNTATPTPTSGKQKKTIIPLNQLHLVYQPTTATTTTTKPAATAETQQPQPSHPAMHRNHDQQHRYQGRHHYGGGGHQSGGGQQSSSSSAPSHSHQTSPNTFARLLSFFNIKEQFFANFILAHNDFQFYHHLQASLVDKFNTLQTCQCSNVNHNHGDYHDRISHLQSLVRLMTLLHLLPTETYHKSSSWQSPSFADISTRCNALPPPVDWRTLLLNSMTSETMVVGIPCVVQFLKMADNVTRETPLFQELTNILKNIYNLPSVIPTPGNHSSFNYTSLFILLELERYFELANTSALVYTHVSLPFAGSGLVTTSPSPSSTPRTPTTPSKAAQSATTPTKSKPSGGQPAADLNPTIGYSMLWADSNNITLMLNDLFVTLRDAATTHSGGDRNLQSQSDLSSNPASISPSKHLIRKKGNQTIKKIAPITASSQATSSEYVSESKLQNQLEYWFFWSHPDIARLSNLLQDTLLPFFSEVIFNLAVPITIKLSNAYIEELRPHSASSSPSKSPQKNNSNNQDNVFQLMDSGNQKLQELIQTLYQRLKVAALKEIDTYCKDNIKTLVMMLAPMSIDDSVLSVATSMISAHLLRGAEDVSLSLAQQRARILAIEITSKKQTVSMTKSSLQLLNISLADVVKNKEHRYTITSVTSNHLKVLDERTDLRTLCTQLEAIHDQLAQVFASEDNVEQLLTSEEDRTKLTNDISILIVKSTALLEHHAAKGDTTDIQSILSTLFRVVLSVFTDLLVIENFYEAQRHMENDTNNNSGNSGNSNDLIVTVTSDIKVKQTRPLYINHSINIHLRSSIVQFIKRLVGIQTSFKQLIPTHLLSPLRIFGLVRQTNNQSLAWMHCYNWIFLTLLQDGIIDCTSIEGSWNNLFDRCFTFSAEGDTSLTGLIDPAIYAESKSNPIINGLQVLPSLLQVICQFVQSYHNHFQSLPAPSPPATVAYEYSKRDFYLCLDLFQQRLDNLKSKEHFKALSEQGTPLADQSITFITSQLSSIFKK
ncbi:hypothetical protein SAMD00019534_004870 [Acytostelium subglobosum LB1]|uniref:hypothetical protein n=1 Tax=Acytostelium subglobosum LB1 TaxID=1410327 RepID=UPI000644D1D8|nr:hypothetical protein SAMD00019534_004870 [Acytostelium subglobosum LB1]GAM17312.1 hypothetical protein SAMD00019534_004870 [Acytostelium subglobosum LB1]|eukprot:XP_012759374.1 hypothetical protein SAMD00019534_004870 [Acytostelium subglobosum LB1]